MKNKILLKYIMVLFLGISIGFFGGKYRYGGKGYLEPRAKDGFRYLGITDGREIYVSSFVTKDEPTQKNLVLKIDDDYIYWESDRNSDGKIDTIMHFENGVLIYESEDTNFDGVLNRKMVESHYKDGSHHRVMVDLNADNNFDLRINNPDKDNAFAEIFVKNQWIKRVKENGQHGIYDAKGRFFPVRFENGQWIVLKSKE